MAKDPAGRPRTALDFVRALQAIEQELRIPLTPIVIAAEAEQSPDEVVTSDTIRRGYGPSARPAWSAGLAPPLPRPLGSVAPRSSRCPLLGRCGSSAVGVLPDDPPAAVTRNRPVAKEPVLPDPPVIGAPAADCGLLAAWPWSRAGCPRGNRGGRRPDRRATRPEQRHRREAEVPCWRRKRAWSWSNRAGHSACHGKQGVFRPVAVPLDIRRSRAGRRIPLAPGQR